MRITDLGILDYRIAWSAQESAHEAVLAGGDEQLLLVEHTPVITLGRRPGVAQHLVANEQTLADMGVELVQSDRGGDITFHGPGQLVAYPIIRLASHGLSVGGYVRRLEEVLIATLAQLGVSAAKHDAGIGVWVREPTAHPIGSEEEWAKIAALGVRIRRGVSLHGIALNVTTDLRDFDLIVPCGLVGRRATSLAKLLGPSCPSMQQVKAVLVEQMQAHFAGRTTATAAEPA